MEKFIEIKNLSKKFVTSKNFVGKPKNFVYALNNFNLNIQRGKTIGLVGESGCGKSTAGRCILNLIKPDSGEVYYKGQNIFNLNKKDFKHVQKNMQIIFQNPYSSLNPRMRIREILAEPLKLNSDFSKQKIECKVDEILEKVGISKNAKNNMPHEFSGGQRQRIVIARALITEPEFIVADEPISALDVSIRTQILQLLTELKNELNLTYLFISHDLGTVEHFCDKVAVMYLGEIVEFAPTGELFKNPLHPYTKALLNSIPKINSETRGNIYGISGEPVSNECITEQCSFLPRCCCSLDLCKKQKPVEYLIKESHVVKCFLQK